MRDVIVIGSGLSGLMGALALAEAGKRPLVLAKGQGATHWTAGTIDLWGRPGDRSLRDVLDGLVTQSPDHPFALAGIAGIEEALARFRAVTESARYPYVGGLERNVLLPTALGALRPTALLPATMAGGDMRLGGELLIAGFRELRDFFPTLAAENLASQGHQARGVYLQLPVSTPRRLDFSTRAFAELFDQPAFREEIGRQLRAARGSATRIGMPAVLGLRDPLKVVQDLQRLSGAQVFEIPTLPPSVPGMRLFEIFRSAIVRAGGRFQLGSWVLHGAGEGGRLTAIYSEAAAREQEHRAGAFLLATGGVAGGGVRTDHTGAIWETALGLPLRAPTGRSEWFAPRFLDEHGHPVFRTGIAVDRQMRPLGIDGQVVFQNVVVAGAALAGADPVRERCHSGMSIVTGWHAGKVLSYA